MYSVNFETLLVSLLEKWTKAVRRKRYFGRFYWILLKYEFFHFSCKFLPISLLAVDTFPALILLAAKQLPAGVTWSPSKFLTCTFGTVTFSVPFGCHYSTKDCKKISTTKNLGSPCLLSNSSHVFLGRSLVDNNLLPFTNLIHENVDSLSLNIFTNSRIQVHLLFLGTKSNPRHTDWISFSFCWKLFVCRRFFLFFCVLPALHFPHFFPSPNTLPPLYFPLFYVLICCSHFIFPTFPSPSTLTHFISQFQ